MEQKLRRVLLMAALRQKLNWRDTVFVPDIDNPVTEKVKSDSFSRERVAFFL